MDVIRSSADMQRAAHAWRRAGLRIGFVPTMGYLHAGHLALVRQARARAVESLESLGLEQLSARRPQTLSGGEAQRVAICAALAHRPRLVLAETGLLTRGEPNVETVTAVHGAAEDEVLRLAGALLRALEQPC